jgi:serine O-acetyltransferase
VGNPGHVVRVEGKKVEGPDADWIHLPDPVADAIKGLASRIEALEHAVADIAGHEAPPPGDVRPLRPVQGRNPAGG